MSDEARRVRTYDSVTDKYDHAITLIDSTAPGAEEAPQLASHGSWRRLARNPTKTSVKEQLSRRKYASWRKDKFDGDTLANESVENEEDAAAGASQAVAEAHPENAESSTVDFGKRPDTADVEEQPKPTEAPVMKRQKKDASEIDVLFENQRGSFFCGIPLYSHSSLLNFDPAAWVTKEFKNSPVNITNAQVPDPSWRWAWKTWYVDMSHDVDEEGWQYSFSFGRSWAWHGTHPWFHSFVRRRRWLRKRVKRTDTGGKEKDGTLEAAHHLNADYFTIHSKARGRSPERTSNPDAQLARPVSFTSFRSTIEEELAPPEEISDIPSLLKALRLAKIDREKVDAVKEFISMGDDELVYLEENMSKIMSMLVFQNSRRQILQSLKDSADEAQQHRDQHDAEDRPEGPKEKRKIDNLLKAAEAANKEIQGLEYWSDRKHVLQTQDEAEDDATPPQSRSGIGEIKGISDKSETTHEIRVDRRLIDKGKQVDRQDFASEKDNQSSEKENANSGLPQDSVFIADDDDEATDDEGAWKGQMATPIHLG